MREYLLPCRLLIWQKCTHVHERPLHGGEKWQSNKQQETWRGGWVAKINNKNERCFSLSKQTERTIDLVRHGRTRTKAKFQLSRKLESRRSYEGGSGSRRTRERDIYAPPESQLTMPSNIAKAIYHHIQLCWWGLPIKAILGSLYLKVQFIWKYPHFQMPITLSKI